MPERVFRPILTGLACLALAACGGGNASPPEPSAEEIAYISSDSPIDRARLHRAVDPLFTSEDMAETRAVIVMRYGKIIAERYAPGYDRETRFLGWSMSKSVTAVLVGLMVTDGRLALDRPAPVPEWQQPGDPRARITLRNLLNMVSGLDHVEAGDPVYKSDEVRMLFLDGHRDMAAYAEAKPLAHPPGEHFQYSTSTSVILSDIITGILALSRDPVVRQQEMDSFFHGRLTRPLGLSSMTTSYDAAGTMVGGSMVVASARDWARFGDFLRTGGSVAGSQIVPRSWIDFMRTSSPDEPAYGGHIWLNKHRPEGRKPLLFPGRGSDDVFACLGYQGQFVVVSPDQGLVVVRLGNTPEADLAPLHRQIGDIVGLFPTN